MVEFPTISATEAAIGGAIVGTGLGLGASAIVQRSRRKSRKRKTPHSKSSRRHSRRGRKVRKTPHTAGKRRDTSRRRIRYTSKGQPYILGANGRPRFISKKSAKRSHSQKGGKY